MRKPSKAQRRAEAAKRVMYAWDIVLAVAPRRGLKRRKSMATILLKLSTGELRSLWLGAIDQGVGKL